MARTTALFSTGGILLTKTSSVTKIKLSKSSLTLMVGKTKKLSYTLTPSSASTKVTWSSSNKKVATVSSSGKITAKKAGTATITVKTSNGKKATCKVTVQNPITSVALSNAFEIEFGETATLEATVSPSDECEEYTLSWKSRDADILTVDDEGNIATASEIQGYTLVAVTATGKYSGVKKTGLCLVTVVHTVHSYDVKTTEATCTKDGCITYTCTECGDSYEVTVEATGHDYEITEKTSSCEKDGYITYTCSGCGDSKSEILSKLEHSYDDGVIIDEPTTTEYGHTLYTCTVCGMTKYITVDKLELDLEE